VKLPLDSFQVLGVSPSSSVQNILMILDRKLERCEYPGFSEETMRRRRDLIRDSSKPLLDFDKRSEYERKYQSKDQADSMKQSIDIGDGYEVAGLVLLLESRLFEECLTLAIDFILQRKSLLGKNKPDTNDLYLAIAYATLEYGRELKSKRYYDYCARILEKGLSHLEDKTDLLGLKKKIEKDQEEITPFRILDLISRDMDDPIREDGIHLLDHFVRERGGLDEKSDLYMEDGEFKSFFRQIRYFLTVQEQIDLYQEWCRSKSQSASFLLAISLVASGFARRKPERLVQALEIMTSLGSDELEEIIAYISLLLGKVEVVDLIRKKSEPYNEKNEQTSSENELANLCAGCREWLERDVLEGYRDLEENPDLEAYFSDRDVTSFIERRDSAPITENESYGRFLGGLELSNKLLNRKPLVRISQKGDAPPNSITSSEETRNNTFGQHLFKKISKGWIIGAGIILIVLLVWFGVEKQAKLKSKTQQESWGEIKDIPSFKSSNTLRLDQRRNDLGHKGSQNVQNRTLDKAIILSLLSDWLNIKAKTLAGQKIPSRVNTVATVEAIRRLENERKEDNLKGEKQNIYVRIISLEIISRADNKIEVDATLSYSDKRLDMQGNVLQKTPKHVFTKRYILVKGGSKWLVE
jgi:hypothetical protein